MRAPMLGQVWAGSACSKKARLSGLLVVSGAYVRTPIPAGRCFMAVPLLYFFCMTLRQAPGHVICNMWSLDPEWLQAYGTNSGNTSKRHMSTAKMDVCVRAPSE